MSRDLTLSQAALGELNLVKKVLMVLGGSLFIALAAQLVVMLPPGALFLILGIPTWDFGGIQDDWDELEDRLGQLDLSGKVVALYGLGDQHGYADYYLDAMGWLHERLAQSNATFVGRWPTEGYDFSASRAVSADGETFCGLALDEDNQFDQTEERVVKWIDQILSEYIAASS